MNGLRLRPATYAILACALIGVTWIVAYHSINWEKDRSFDEGEKRAIQLALFFERHTLGILRYSDSYVRMARREYQRHGVTGVRDLLRLVPLDTSLVSHITVIDANGTPVLVSGHQIKSGTTAKDRDYFLAHKRDTGDRMSISLPHVGRNSGKLIVRLVRRITDASGDFGGVVFAALEAKIITDFFSAMNLGPNSSATLVGSLDKRIRARSSYGRLGPGQEISGSRIWQELERSTVGLYKQTSVVDHITRHYAYRKLSEFPLIVAIGVATEDLSEAVTQFQTDAYIIAALVSILIAVMTFLLSREIRLSQKLIASESQLEQRVEERTRELQKVQDELLKKERLAVLGQLTGTVAHELRNPLGTITASIAIIEKKLKDSAVDVGATIKRLLRNVDRCNDIIAELLDFTRGHHLDVKPTRLDRWLAGVLEEIDGTAGFTLKRDLEEADLTVAFDRGRIRRAIINLLDNARDSLKGNGAGRTPEITVSSRIGAERVFIEITDNGEGIRQEVLPKVYDLLFSTKSFGVGLGLPIVQRIMEDHGGGLEIASEEGKGTRAVLWLPKDTAEMPSYAQT